MSRVNRDPQLNLVENEKGRKKRARRRARGSMHAVGLRVYSIHVYSTRTCTYMYTCIHTVCFLIKCSAEDSLKHAACMEQDSIRGSRSFSPGECHPEPAPRTRVSIRAELRSGRAADFIYDNDGHFYQTLAEDSLKTRRVHGAGPHLGIALV